MDLLLQKYNDYMRLVGCVARYELSDGTVIEVTYKEENFLHLLGLHKIVDIQLIQFWLDRNNKTVKLIDVIKGIKNGTLTDAMVKGSHFYQKIQDRYENFSYDNLTTLIYTDAIIDFDATVIHSKIKSDYILYEEKKQGEYNHMGIAKDVLSGTRYVETFFYEPSDKYIIGQKTVKVRAYKLYDANGNIIFEDAF